MEQILEDIYVIEVPRTGQSAWKPATDEPVSCHVVTGEETVLFGTGHGGSADVLIGALDELGGVDVVVAEHGDTDHYAGIPPLLDHFGDLTIAIPAADAAIIEKVYYGVTPDIELEDGDRYWGWQAIHVPGHTAGNMAFLDESRGLLNVGDTFVHSQSPIAADGDWSGAFAPIDPAFSMDDQQARENLTILDGYEFDAALITHGADVLTDADREFETLLADLGLQ